jgi:molybdopterin synthase catalytic subunit/molybdopterin converting factor small subunit
MSQIHILFFASLRSKAGIKSLDIPCENECTVRDLKRLLGERYHALAPALQSCVVSINHQFAFDDDLVPDNAEVGFFPPVSGGSDELPTITAITDQPLSVDQLVAQITTVHCGAVCSFTGTVRGVTTRGEAHETSALEYEAYQPMAEAKMKQIADEIRQRYPQVIGIAIVQRIGWMETGTPSVVVACSTSHRDAGVFEAARYGIDRLKEIVPVWKKEITPQGEEWVDGAYQPKRGD